MKGEISKIKEVLAKCPLAKKEDIGLADDGKAPCELCAYIEKATKVIQKAEEPLLKIATDARKEDHGSSQAYSGTTGGTQGIGAMPSSVCLLQDLLRGSAYH